MDEIREKGLWFNCDSKYSKGHKCGEKEIILHVDCEVEEAKVQEPSQAEEIKVITYKYITPIISWHALIGISTPQNLKIKGYLKKKKATMLIDFGSSHNFIHCKLAKVLNWFIYPTLDFN